MGIQNICVYCGSSSRIDETYKKSAATFGSLLARNNVTVIYGGGHVGLMGIMADAALAAGGKVVGIIPEHLHTREEKHLGLSELHIVKDMHTRKKMMADRADAFLALPGGFGTLDEVFEILTWKQIGLHNKPIIIYNEKQFWTPLISLINHIIGSGFAPNGNKNIYHVIDHPDQLMPALNAPPDPVTSIEEKWAVS